MSQNPQYGNGNANMYNPEYGQPSVIEVVNPPDDNFNSDDFSSDSYSQDTGGNGTMTSYGTPTIMVNNMVQQMKLITSNNCKLKEAIRLNNQGFQTKLLELQQWKERWRGETVKIKQNHANARNTIMNLKREKLFLEAENAKLLVRLASQPRSSGEGETDNDPENPTISSDTIHSKLLSTIEGLQKQLKIVTSEKQELETEVQLLKSANLKLQQNAHNANQLYGKLDTSHQKMVEMRDRLLKERDVMAKHVQDLETAKKERNVQLLSVIDESKAYKAENAQLKQKNDKLVQETKELRTRGEHNKEAIQKLKKEKQFIQTKSDRENAELRKTLQEKFQSFDELYNEYETTRKNLEKVSADHQSCREKDFDKMYARFLCAEESLKKKDHDLKRIEGEGRNYKRQLDGHVKKMEDDIAFFKAQADVYKQDFLIEREDRSKLHEQNQKFHNLLYEKDRDIDQLKKKLEQLQFDHMRR